MSIDEAFEKVYHINEERLKVDSQYRFQVDEKKKVFAKGYKQGRVETLDELYQIFVNIHENVKNRFSDEAFLELGKKIYDKFIIEKEGELEKAKQPDE